MSTSSPHLVRDAFHVGLASQAIHGLLDFLHLVLMVGCSCRHGAQNLDLQVVHLAPTSERGQI